MQKQECPPPTNFKQKNNSQLPSSSTLSNSTEPSFFFTKNQFVDWLKVLSTEQRYLAVQVKAPKAISIIRNSYKRFEEEKLTDFPKTPTQHQQKGKVFLKQSKTLIEGLVFLSGEYYLDTLGFDFNMVECPEKIYDLLTYFKEEKNKKVEETPKEKKAKTYNFEGTSNKEEWVLELVKFLKRNLVRLYGITWNPQILQDEKFRKREFSFYWKHLSSEQKLNILYLGCCDTKELLLKLIDMDIPLNPTIIETEIQDLMKMDKNEFCNRIFKCKLKKCASKVYSYYGLIYNRWKESVEKSKKKRSKKNNKKKNIKRNQRNKSLGGYSNETNQTEYKEEKFDINVQDIAMNKLEQDILDCSDWISDRANQFFDRRVLTFERIQSLLQLYEVPVKLYGSCASGIAIENSDVDIAIDDKILSYYQHLKTTREKLEASLEFLYELFSQIPWVKNVKLISKALVPLIKLTIDTQIPVSQTFFPQDFKKKLNRVIKKGGKVSADLTIQTKNEDQSTNHLGIISTVTINSWLEEIPTLRTLILILKYHLTKRQLNETYANGLNTYCLIVMIVAFLDYAKLREEKSVAIVISQFLKFYGWEFDEKIQKIDLLNKDVIFTKTEKHQNCAALQINDPLCNGRIMTRNCYRFDEIKELMREISKKCINRTVNEVEEMCSKWDPKQKFLTGDRLYEMVVERLKDNYFISQLK